MDWYKLLDTLGKDLAQANIKIDGSGDKKFKMEFERYLRTYLSGRISKLSFINSKGNDLIQLADMCAGAINRTVSCKPDAIVYKSIIARNIANVWNFQ